MPVDRRKEMGRRGEQAAAEFFERRGDRVVDPTHRREEYSGGHAFFADDDVATKLLGKFSQQFCAVDSLGPGFRLALNRGRG